jgi:hypothetical protein
MAATAFMISPLVLQTLGCTRPNWEMFRVSNSFHHVKVDGEARGRRRQSQPGRKSISGRSNILGPRTWNIVSGVFTPALAKHLESFSLIDCISVGVDPMQRNFEPIRKQVEAWQGSELTDVTGKVVIHEAFVEGGLEAPKHLARALHDLYF